MIDSGLQKLRHIIRKLSVDGIIKPAELCDSTHKLDQRSDDKVLHGRSLGCQVAKDIISDINAL
jgi:hypothetical protein